MKSARLAFALWAAGVAAMNAQELQLEAISDTLPFYDATTRHVREVKRDDRKEPLTVWLSRSRYWAEDGHLDVVADLDDRLADALGSALADTRIKTTLRDEIGRELASMELTPPSRSFIFYPAIPDQLHGGTGSIEVAWVKRDGTPLGKVTNPFRVAIANRKLERRGTVAITVPNEGKARGTVSVTVGVPFPRGVLTDVHSLRLRKNGEDLPFEAREIARWSKLGSIKWIHLNFTVKLAGTASELLLEYGSAPASEPKTFLVAKAGSDFPPMDVGPLRFDNGIWYAPEGSEKYVKVLDEKALSGGYVKDGAGRLYEFDRVGPYQIESAGSESTVVRKEGWYRYAGKENGRMQFCKHVTRYVIHNGSPLVRIFNSWIFTGDGNRDQIANMGWEFRLAEGIRPQGFLKTFASVPEWQSLTSLLQWDYEHCDLRDRKKSTATLVHRSPGVAYVKGDGVGMLLGIRDFWQNYPAELEFTDRSLWFHNWPRQNRPAGYSFSGELVSRPGVPAEPSASRHSQYKEGRLSLSEWTLNLLQARFAHEGRKLSFRLPDEAAEEPVIARMRAGRPWAKYWRDGEPESINAQGISKTEEMWLYFFPDTDDAAAAQASSMIQGLGEGYLRAVVDPKWVAASGVFYEMHHQDWEKYPEVERAFEQLALAPARWQEHLGLYGKWIYGDITGWDLGLETREPALYRAYRKRHHGWPYSWLPYVRSGDPRLLKAADIATRHNIDANWRHYATGGRRKGLVPRSTLPWAMTIGEDENATRTRCYESKVDYLLASWYVTGYHRAWDLFREWAELTKVEESGKLRGPIGIRGPWGNPVDSRFPLTVMKSYLETYEATFDPWFLVASHEIAKGFAREIEEEGSTGTPYVTAFREFHRYTGNAAWKEYYLRYADKVGGRSWDTYVDPLFEPNGYAWLLTGEARYLGQLRNMLEWTVASVWNGEEPEYLKGFYLRGGGHEAARTTGWMLQHLPFALYVLNQSEAKPELVTEPMEIGSGDMDILLLKSTEAPLNLHLQGRLKAKPTRSKVPYELTGPDGVVRSAGKWSTKEPLRLSIPGSDAPGVYRLALSNCPSIVVPVSEGKEVKESIAFPPGGRVVLGGYQKQLWFMVPEGVDQFRAEMDPAKNAAVRRISIWAPDGSLAWDLNSEKKEAKASATAQVRVPKGAAGQLWRITTPGNHGTSFQMDARILPIFVTSPSRWSAEFEDYRRASHTAPGQ